MALISCPDCGHKVSSLAPVCPHCGRPVATSSTHLGTEKAIEFTAKRLKLWSALSVFMTFIGLVLMLPVIFSSADSKETPVFGIVVTAFGVVSYIITKVRIWWHHE